MELNEYDIDCIYAARDLIEKHLHWHYTIPEIAKQVGLNELKLKKGFKQVFGLALFEFLTIARMEKAKSLLMETRKSLKQIAHAMGYKHTSNFITAFIKKYNQSPTDFRKQLKEYSQLENEKTRSRRIS